MNILLGKTLTELQAIALELGLKKFVGTQLAQWLYQQRVTSFDEMTNIAKSARELLASHYIIGRHAPVRQAVSSDGTIKYLFEIPTPLLQPEGRYSSTPYIEMGCGIGNILRVLDLHSVWRLTNREDSTTPRWALRFRFHLGL